MKLNKVILFVFLCVKGLFLSAQEFTYVDWDILKIDTVPPFYQEVIPLTGDDFSDYRYEVCLEYPEYGALSAEEVKRVAEWGDSLPDVPEVQVRTGISRKKGMLDVSFLPIVCREGKYKKLLSFKMKIVRHPKSRTRHALVRNTVAARYAGNSVLAQGRWVKIGVTEEGVYRLTPSALQRMGFSDPSRVKLYGYGGRVQNEVIDADNDFDDLEEVPLYRDAKGLLFYAHGLVSWDAPKSSGALSHVVNPYAKSSCYFLTEGDAPLAIETVTVNESWKQEASDVRANVLYKKEEFAWYQSGRNLYEAYNYATGNTRTYRLPLVDFSAGGSAPSLTVAFTAAGSSSNSVRPAVNGESLSAITINSVPTDGYTAAMTGKRTYTLSNLTEADAAVEVALTTTSGVEGRLDYLSLHYRRKLKLSEPYQYIRHYYTTTTRLAIDMNGRSQVKLWRLGQRGEPMVELAGKQEGGTYWVTVDKPTREYVAVDVEADFPAPVFIEEIANQNLHATPQTDMVIIVPKSGKLLAQAQRLAEAHQRINGLKVTVVRADQIYNEYSSGTPDATAYRRYLKMLYDRAETADEAPRYLLLFGDGVWDNRMLTSATRNLNPDDYLLCFESVNSLSHTQSFVMEDYFGLLDDGEGGSLTYDKVDLGIGRFPVATEADAKIMVDKTIDYMENKNAGSWKNVVCVMGDDGDRNEHLEMADDVAKLVEKDYPEVQVKRIIWDAYKRESSTTTNTYPGAKEDIRKQMSEGCLMMNYVGHGNPSSLSHELVLVLSDFSSYTSPKMPLWVTAACDIAPFDMIEDNIGETSVLNPQATAVAFYGTTRTVYATPNSYMNMHFTRFVLGSDESGRRNSIGDAVRLAKVNLISAAQSGNAMGDGTVNKLHYVLLGDPALKLGKPEYKIVVDSINGMPIKEGEPFAEFKSGSMARVTGYLEDTEGTRLPAYQGSVTATVYDSKSTIVCLNNADENVDPFVFEERDKILYKGSDSIRNGRFEMTFPIPLDIKYSGEAGRIVFYAINNERTLEASGYTEHVLVGGSSDELSGDKEGPHITAYLNREDFQYGGEVNATPYFVALLEDESGINTTETGVGHNLELIIDGSPNTSYVLNPYYINEFGDYRKGQVAYTIPELPDGKHKLLFRAWDVLNNSSSVELEFNVNKGLSPELIDVVCSENPAKTQTTFLIRYDRPGMTCNFMLEVFDFAGRKLWSHTEQGNSEGIYPVKWNLTTSSGMPLSTGVYLYRVSVSTPDSKAVSRTNKIVILGNK